MNAFRNNYFFLPSQWRASFQKGKPMKENMKAALLSALVLPGVGQLYRGRKLKGSILVLFVTLLLLVAVILAVMAIQDALRGTGGPGGMDPVILAGRLSNWVPAALWLLGAFLCLWVYGIADALMDAGKKKDSAESGQKPETTDVNR
jgi:TM2 domain-containing membrane protein YozV